MRTAQRSMAEGLLAVAFIQGPVAPTAAIGTTVCDMRCQVQEVAESIEGARVVGTERFIGVVYNNGKCGVGFERRLNKWEPYGAKCPTGYGPHLPYRPWEY